VFAFAEHLPDVGVFESGERGDFELEKVVLRGAGRMLVAVRAVRLTSLLQVYGVNALWSLSSIAKDVVTRASDGKNNIVFVDLEDSFIGLVVFPRKAKSRKLSSSITMTGFSFFHLRINVFVVELSMLLERFVIVYPPVMSLIPS